MAPLRARALAVALLAQAAAAASCCGADCGSSSYYPRAPSGAISCYGGVGSSAYALSALTGYYCYSAHRTCRPSDVGYYGCAAAGQVLREYGAISTSSAYTMTTYIYWGTFTSGYPEYVLRTLSLCNTNGCNQPGSAAICGGEPAPSPSATRAPSSSRTRAPSASATMVPQACCGSSCVTSPPVGVNAPLSCWVGAYSSVFYQLTPRTVSPTNSNGLVCLSVTTRCTASDVTDSVSACYGAPVGEFLIQWTVVEPGTAQSMASSAYSSIYYNVFACTGSNCNTAERTNACARDIVAAQSSRTPTPASTFVPQACCGSACVTSPPVGVNAPLSCWAGAYSAVFNQLTPRTVNPSSSNGLVCISYTIRCAASDVTDSRQTGCYGGSVGDSVVQWNVVEPGTAQSMASSAYSSIYYNVFACTGSNCNTVERASACARDIAAAQSSRTPTPASTFVPRACCGAGCAASLPPAVTRPLACYNGVYNGPRVQPYLSSITLTNATTGLVCASFFYECRGNDPPDSGVCDGRAASVMLFAIVAPASVASMQDNLRVSGLRVCNGNLCNTPEQQEACASQLPLQAAAAAQAVSSNSPNAVAIGVGVGVGVGAVAVAVTLGIVLAMRKRALAAQQQPGSEVRAPPSDAAAKAAAAGSTAVSV